MKIDTIVLLIAFILGLIVGIFSIISHQPKSYENFPHEQHQQHKQAVGKYI